MIAHLDWMPTLLAAAGVPDITEKLLNGYTAGNKKIQSSFGWIVYVTITYRPNNKKIPRIILYFYDDAN